MRAPTVKIKVSCLGIVDKATVPRAVLAADISLGRQVPAARYVLLPFDERSALSEMLRANATRTTPGAGIPYSPNVEIAHPRGAHRFPALIRTHAFDVKGALADDEPLERRDGSWLNGESLWVSATLADTILRGFYTWRDKFPRRAGAIWAPSWHVLVAVQALALAAGFRVPQAEDEADAGHGCARAAVDWAIEDAKVEMPCGHTVRRDPERPEWCSACERIQEKHDA